MSARSAHSFIVSATLAIGSIALPSYVRADDTAQATPEVDNAKYNFEGSVNAAATQVRSGPGDNYYPTDKLDKGAAVTVVGIRYDWLKVTPPQGSFSYVAKAFVTRFGDGTKGRVDKPDLRVRAGSSINPMKTTVQTTLNVGDEVTILGEVDEYYKIAPPAGVFLYVNKQFVDAVKQVDPVASKGAAPTPPIAKNDAKTPDAPVKTDVTSTPTVVVAKTPTTEPAVADGGTPSTQPVAVSSESTFDKLEADFNTMSAEPLDQQPLDPALAGYVALQSSDLPESLKRIVDVRVATLKARSDAKVEFLALKKTEDEATQRQVALKAEQTELQDRIKKEQVSMFTAVGTLRTSSLQAGATTMYRLTDPANGRTLVYIKSNDPAYSGMLGQFIGVHGQVITDQQMSIRYVTPSDASAVDPAKVNNGVTAEIIPSSLLPKVSSLQ